jgi:hypothetical protein
MFQRVLVEAVGIGLKATLRMRNLLILLNGENAKNTGFAQARYTRGTRRRISWEKNRSALGIPSEGKGFLGDYFPATAPIRWLVPFPKTPLK